MDNCMKGFLLFKNDQWVLSCFIKSFSWLTQDLANFQGAQSMHIFRSPQLIQQFFDCNAPATADMAPKLGSIWTPNWLMLGFDLPHFSS